MAANEKRKTNPNWSLKLKMLLPLNTIKILCLRKETVHLALEMLNDIPEVDAWEEWLKQTLFMHVARALCGFKNLEAAKKLILKMIADNQRPSIYVINIIITAYVKAGEIGQVLEMVMLLERRSWTNAKRRIVSLLYHTLIAGYCRLQKFDIALKSLTRMKDFGVSHINLDEYQKLIHSLSLMAMDIKMAREQLEEMEPMDRKMAEKQLSKIAAMDLHMREEKLEEMYLSIKEFIHVPE
ncbi:putative pentatricopeptide [Medicago truncatula]|uniref:Putative pentatricopeptide n=1 Tax=Medicago truncatula TaxID=3880 RepID=A0A396GMU1_MEDTR|nr:putative pentatricopeptide [Medicago truncatula]